MEDKILDALENNNALPEDLQEKLSSVLERYQQLTDEEKEEFHKGAFDVLKNSLNKLPGDTFLPTWLAPYQSYMLFTFAVSAVGLMLVFGILKLYWRMKERENRRIQKKKLKEERAAKKRK